MAPMSDTSPPPSATFEPAPRVQEQLLIDCLPQIAGERILCTTAGLGQFAAAAATTFDHGEVHCLFLDLYRAQACARRLGLKVQLEPQLAAANGAAALTESTRSNLTLHCATDFPEIEADCAALPLSAGGEAELTRDLLQSAHDRLRIGGALFVSTDNPRDTWLEQQLRKLPGKVNRRAAAEGVLYVLHKTAPLRKHKNFACEFVFRDRQRLLRGISRPGVFSHRHVDPGARRLMETMEIAAGQRVLEIGCGSGAASLAAASRAVEVTVQAIDSAARAVVCLRQAAELNELPSITAQLDATGDIPHLGSYDLALANPPYYANFRIAQHFVMLAERALVAGGQLLLVTKQPDWYAEQAPLRFVDVQIEERKGYYVVSAVRPG
jgi:16S rRNA (guanine1207-N2)-methyltransferase